MFVNDKTVDEKFSGSAENLGMKKKKPSPATPEQAAFAKRLAAIRLLAGYKTRKAGAMALGYEEPRYSRWERGEREPGISDVHQICRGFNVTPNDLYGYAHGEREGT